jgi:RNA polymerase sigma-70 factor (ECF subfamily)
MQTLLVPAVRLYSAPGVFAEDAQDLVQGFFLHLIEYKTLSRVDRSKGKFRSFLLASLPNYLTNEADRARCLKRGGKVEFVHIDLEDAEDRYELEPIEELTPEKVFDARWAMALLGEAMNRLSLEYMTQGKATTFEANGEGSGIRILPRRTAIY